MMRYSEIPHDFSSDSLHFAEITEEQMFLNTRDESPSSDLSSHSGPALPLIGSSGSTDKKFTDYSQIKHHTLSRDPRVKKLSLGCSNTTLGSSGGHEYGYINHGLITSKKSNSLPTNSTIQEFDTQTMSALRLSPEDIASQITLLDFPIFAAIQPDELTSCAWTKKNKITVTPNIVAFTKRFNHTSFWTVQEILNGATPKIRAELIGHFIRVAKKLLELNNLHSLFAIVSALQSASIYRLVKTWACLSRKEKQTFDRLADIFNDRNNWANLREYSESLRVPCIPYIGLFLTDLIYIDLAFPHKGSGLEPEQRKTQMNNILRVISNYQGSDYGHIPVMTHVQKYLQSVRFIEELQNIFEEDQYKKSLKLEPSSSVPSSSSCCIPSKEQRTHSVDSVAIASLNLSPAKSVSATRSSSAASSTAKFVPGHRKSRSLGTNIFSKTCQIGVTPMTNSCSESLDAPSYSHLSRHLLDDSVLEDKALPDAISTGSSDGVFGTFDMDSDTTHESLEFQGCIRRKTVLKDGRKPAVASWQRYWLQIWANSLVYFPPKSFKGNERSDFKQEPCKVCPLDGWCVEQVENIQQANTFQLVNVATSTIYKFRTSSPKFTALWLDSLNRISRQDVEKQLPVNLMSFE
ncbi:ras-specific guanine nucleotide-releasing factor RalGPS1 isoform X2 [Lutzomyia longipalpis]|uniref:ras-specific guanine nucleotide-releasing factor RalGPS1 isoform X2 n=1 Tax=Lutzomyia longipalpis TaxID=7200 RepID=UPI00248462F7|nr:ras-specific guanine nucleotide-releasing factor RalGPS1 isoform X2 [Lutzomyia longipalpis]